MTEENNSCVIEEKECCCKACKIVKCLLVVFIAVCTAISAYYSYNTNKTLNAIVGGTGAAQAGTPSSGTITKKYAKGQTFEKALKKEKPVVVFFYADWCGYCKRFAPVFAKVTKSKQFKNNFSVAYVNCDDSANAALVSDYGIQGFPTVFVVDKANNIKNQVDNGDLFAPDAETELVNTFLKQLNK